MSFDLQHRVLAAGALQVPAPFSCFAVRSDEALHAHDARAPYGQVHLLHAPFVDAASRRQLVADGCARTAVESFSDIDYAPTDWPALAATAPALGDLPQRLVLALQATGVLGTQAAAYRRCVAGRVDYLACCGAGFHNDVSRHWPRCLFWLLALDAVDVELVLPHAGLRLPLQADDLVVFDPALAHGLCRPQDDGRALAASFQAGPHRRQLFLTGEMLLSDAQWAALGSPWMPVDAQQHQAALDLRLASFDDRSGAIQRLSALRGGMQRDAAHPGTFRR